MPTPAGTVRRRRLTAQPSGIDCQQRRSPIDICRRAVHCRRLLRSVNVRQRGRAHVAPHRGAWGRSRCNGARPARAGAIRRRGLAAPLPSIGYRQRVRGSSPTLLAPISPRRRSASPQLGLGSRVPARSAAAIRPPAVLIINNNASLTQNAVNAGDRGVGSFVPSHRPLPQAVMNFSISDGEGWLPVRYRSGAGLRSPRSKAHASRVRSIRPGAAAPVDCAPSAVDVIHVDALAAQVSAYAVSLREPAGIVGELAVAQCVQNLFCRRRIPPAGSVPAAVVL